MNKTILIACLLAASPALILAQSPKAATYITDEQVKAVNATPGIDRQLVRVDIGKLNLAVGIIHRGPTTPPAAGAAGGGAGAPQPATEPCGETTKEPVAGSVPRRLLHGPHPET